MRNPNTLLVIITILSLAIMALVVVRDVQSAPQVVEWPTPEPAPTPTPTAAPVDASSDGIPVGRTNARLVADSYCAGGQGWQWLESVPDGMGGENLIIKGSCDR